MTIVKIRQISIQQNFPATNSKKSFIRLQQIKRKNLQKAQFPEKKSILLSPHVDMTLSHQQGPTVSKIYSHNRMQFQQWKWNEKKTSYRQTSFYFFYIHFIVESWKKKLQKQYLINQKNLRGACQQNNIDNVYTGENQYNVCKPFKIMQLGHLINNLAFTVTLECLSVLFTFRFRFGFLN